MAEPVTARRRDAEDLRSGQPVLPLVHASNAAEPDLALADFAVPRARGAHDLVRAIDRPPELGDLAHRLARRLPDIEDFRFRNHRVSVHWSYRVKTLFHWVTESRRDGSAPSPCSGAVRGRIS